MSSSTKTSSSGKFASSNPWLPSENVISDLRGKAYIQSKDRYSPLFVTRNVFNFLLEKVFQTFGSKKFRRLKASLSFSGINFELSHYLRLVTLFSSRIKNREFPGGPVVRTRRSHCWGPGSISGPGTKTLQASRPGQKIK